MVGLSVEGVEGAGGYLGKNETNDDWIRRAIGGARVNQTTVCIGSNSRMISFFKGEHHEQV